MDIAAPRRFENDVNEAFTLTAEQLELLDTDQNLQRKLRDSRLLEILRRIHNAEDKKAALDEHMKTDPEFLDFCDDVLERVAFHEMAA